MKLEEIIDALILDIYPLMPSTGSWPFTMLNINRHELSGMELHPQFFASSGLLVLKRTDFNEESMMDYVLGSKEYGTLLPAQKHMLLERYRKMINSPQELEDWADKITNLAIGLIIQSTLLKGLQFSPIETDLSVLDARMGFNTENLSAYKLFDVYQIDPSFLASSKKNH